MSLANVVVIGAQWGDEGKGKITDLLSRSADVVVRYQGGVNAGHTIVVDERVLKLHLIPSGILYPDTICLIGSGTVVDPKVMLGELDMLIANDIDISGLQLASTAHVTMPYHRMLDQAMEKQRGDRRIGTTGRGIGPTYADKSQRSGIRVIDLLDEQRLRDRLEGPLSEKNQLLQTIYGVDPLDPDTVIQEYLDYGRRLAPHVVDCTRAIHEAARARKNILFEGAQGTLLDIDHGTYPYVTSSNTTAGGTATGTGFGPLYLDYVLGITKAYTTRVGSGPFPTELFDETGRYLAEKGHEFGSTTGRARRCGWFDAVALKRAIQINSISGLCLTKLDVLDGLEEVNICVGYQGPDGKALECAWDADSYSEVTPVYESVPGWSESTIGVKKLEDLPDNARAYLKRIEEVTGAPIDIISTGPDRAETIVQRHPFG